MLHSVLVYGGLTYAMLLFNSISAHKCNILYGTAPRKSNIPLLAILLFAFVFGIRYNVGIDHLAYLNMYETVRIGGKVDTEPGFLFLMTIFGRLGLHYSYFFFFLAFIQLFLLFYALREHYKIFGWMILTFMLSTMFLNFMNGMRQELAFCFETVALLYLSRKNFILCYLNIGLGILFHTSAVLLLPLPLFYIKKDYYFNNINVQISLFFTLAIIAILFKPAVFIFSSIMDYLEILGYEGYKYMVLGGDLSFLEAKKEAGLGFLLLICLNLVNILYSNKIKRYYNSTLLNILYDFYFVGLLYNYLSSGSLILGRINYYFYNYNFVITAFLLYYLYKNQSYRNMLILITLILAYLVYSYAVLFMRGGVENCAIYHICF